MLASNRMHAHQFPLMWPNMHVHVEADYALNTTQKQHAFY
ncbi:hypothetical protein F383_28126 [Gossypium arboreum]|uniref:Uncharacterized protein n=1 Tax=Gossypium arboreum TaxID=29729 RepID=A0A0B0P5H7_GOSAR|nr:hypothetical protein F383_28126 [Gossypium arboreum]